MPTKSDPATVLYDGNCGLCRWLLAKFLRWDRRRLLHPVALQDPEAERLLGAMDEETRMGSWHLVEPDGTVSSAGAAVPPVLRRLPGGGPLAAMSAAMPRLSERIYRLVAGNRDRLGPLIPAGAKQRANRRVRERGAG